jgi:hypothetical protein
MPQIPEQACQLMVYCRAIAVMTEEEFLDHYRNKLSQTAKRQLKSFPAINSQPRRCLFPWNPAGIVESRQEPSPALSNSVPSILPLVGVQNLNPNRQEPIVNRRRRRSIESSAASEESYGPPTTRSRIQQTPDNNVISQVLIINESPFEKVKRLLTQYSTKLKFQRYPDSRTNIRPYFETDAYYNLQAERSEENEELLSKFFIDIKDSLALAYEATANANVHHFNIGQKLAMLEERMDHSQFNLVLSDLGLDRQ